VENIFNESIVSWLKRYFVFLWGAIWYVFLILYIELVFINILAMQFTLIWFLWKFYLLGAKKYNFWTFFFPFVNKINWSQLNQSLTKGDETNTLVIQRVPPGTYLWCDFLRPLSALLSLGCFFENKKPIERGKYRWKYQFFFTMACLVAGSWEL